MKPGKTSILLGLLLLGSQALAEQTPEQLARAWCANCHMADGNSISPLFPRLAGQQAAYLQQQLQMFRAKSRSDDAAHDYMWGVAGGLSDEQIMGVAAYFAAQKPAPNPAKRDENLIAAGKLIYEQGKESSGTPACQACHGPRAEGTDQGPRLAGQHAPYLMKQLHVFESPQRPSAVAMQAIIKTLSADDLHALTAYLQSL
ncbi:c-type cytochrome [Chromobacterium sp. ASV23]|uniref:c-type cytochrome n=1 Tax=Chromobacterium sp. ASV23 TaxID=2795110 RepID=UPI0018EC777D|nr:c-type cytochrome [Chromobacterium sp. ASV23]